ncbi:P-loop containing nucleoside triphosphate hydrolase protein [Mycena rebaudengoi]|nr:P-loop containing nucleoside triphosphate hydrolase protein [Mycena rebaudengoi]
MPPGSCCESLGTSYIYRALKPAVNIEVGLVERRPDVQAICQAVFARLLLVIFNATTDWASESISPVLQTRMRLHFQEHILRAELRIDLPTSVDSNYNSYVDAEHAWRSFDALREAAQGFCELLCQLLFISQQNSGGNVFTLLALVRPVLAYKMFRSLWMKSYVLYSKNAAYLRLRSLQSLAQTRFRGDIIAGNIAGWIVAEYQRARKALGSVSDAEPYIQYGMFSTSLPKIAQAVSGDLTLLYWATNAILRPERFSMTSIAILHQYSTTLNITVATLFWNLSRLGKCVTDIKALYEVAESKNKMVDGDEAYPRAGVDSDKGMEIDVRNVSFAYPGSTTTDNALHDVSFRIPAGALVVLVGANGSGKSTIIKLLTRLYDPDAGEIHVDGRPIERFRLADLRRAQATLAQEHYLYPLTLAENIGLGNPERVDDLEMVMQAAADGGAAALLKKFRDGTETNLEPALTAYGYELDDKRHKALKDVLATLEKTGEVSGGEKQRLVASRTFMRFRTGTIKLVCVDEPSSALDPKGEHALFERLRASGSGKTMIFVTHRFGRLTKHADLILCMKDGQIVESGTHKELMGLGSEYAELIMYRRRLSMRWRCLPQKHGIIIREF